MPIDEAIEFNQALEKDLRAKGMPSFADAIKLGIEALKEIKALRHLGLDAICITLPGETEE